MATAKKAAGKAAAGKQAKASDVDDILGGGEAAAEGGAEAGSDDVLEGKAAKKGGKGAAKSGGKGGGKKAEAAPAKAGKKAAAKSEGGGRTGTTDAVRKALAATRKLSTYNDVAEAGGFDLRLVRRTARAMDEEGVLERVKEGTVIYVKAKKAA